MLKARTALILALALVGPVLMGSKPNSTVEAYTRAYGPKVTVQVARPTLVWEVWPGEGCRISHLEMAIDGHTVTPKYDDERRRLEFTPEAPLSAGTHRVECTVMIDGVLPVHKDWQFKVAEGASPNLVPASSLQLQVLGLINQRRNGMGLDAFVGDDRLADAALAHTEYLKANKVTGHYETAGRPGFIGVQPIERLESFGFIQDSWECVDFGGDNPAECLRELFDAPYHRIPFMQPGGLLCGAGYDDNRLTIEFEMSKQTATVVSPYAGEKDVSIRWNGFERPDPLRFYKTSGAVGHIVVFSHFSPESEKIVVHAATITDENGADVPIYLNTPASDDKLTSSAFLIPKNPLKPQTSYTVCVSAQTESGKDISKTWTFSTGAAKVR